MHSRPRLPAHPTLLALLSAALAGPAAAAEAHLPVRGGVSPACTFTQSPHSMALPDIDPSGTATYVVTRTVGVRCTHGTLLRWSINGASQSPVMRHMSAGGTPHRMPYHLSWAVSSSTGNGFGAKAQEATFTLTATLPPASYQDAAGGHYDDILHVQLTP